MCLGWCCLSGEGSTSFSTRTHPGTSAHGLVIPQCGKTRFEGWQHEKGRTRLGEIMWAVLEYLQRSSVSALLYSLCWHGHKPAYCKKKGILLIPWWRLEVTGWPKCMDMLHYMFGITCHRNQEAFLIEMIHWWCPSKIESIAFDKHHKCMFTTNISHNIQTTGWPTWHFSMFYLD